MPIVIRHEPPAGLLALQGYLAGRTGADLAAAQIEAQGRDALGRGISEALGAVGAGIGEGLREKRKRAADQEDDRRYYEARLNEQLDEYSLRSFGLPLSEIDRMRGARSRADVFAELEARQARKAQQRKLAEDIQKHHDAMEERGYVAEYGPSAQEEISRLGYEEQKLMQHLQEGTISPEQFGQAMTEIHDRLTAIPKSWRLRKPTYPDMDEYTRDAVRGDIPPGALFWFDGKQFKYEPPPKAAGGGADSAKDEAARRKFAADAWSDSVKRARDPLNPGHDNPEAVRRSAEQLYRDSLRAYDNPDFLDAPSAAPAAETQPPVIDDRLSGAIAVLDEDPTKWDDRSFASVVPLAEAEVEALMAYYNPPGQPPTAPPPEVRERLYLLERILTEGDRRSRLLTEGTDWGALGAMH